jgi:hypothetical protein
MSVDPLSEAREALRFLLGLPKVRGYKRAESKLEVLARLDALPAPVYSENVLARDFGLPGPRGCWIYPDVPVAP